MKKVFVDTNICLDLLAQRVPYFEAAQVLHSLADTQQIKLFTSAQSFMNIYYILQNRYKSGNVAAVIREYRKLINILSINEQMIDLALRSAMTDFEDAVQVECAYKNGVDVFITRNIKDFKTVRNLEVLTPDAFIDKYYA